MSGFQTEHPLDVARCLGDGRLLGTSNRYNKRPFRGHAGFNDLRELAEAIALILPST